MSWQPGATCLARTLLWAIRWSGRQAGAAVVYHAVAERSGDPRREILPAIGASELEDQLSQLASSYRVVPIGELVAAASGRRRGDPFPVAITFDDELPSHAELAMPILLRLGLPAAFFLSGPSSEHAEGRWWHHLQGAFDVESHSGRCALQGVLQEARIEPEGGIHRVARAIETLDLAERRALVAKLRGLAGAATPLRALTAGGVRAIVDAGFDVGFHTRGHERLDRLADNELKAALEDGHRELEELVERPIDMIAYPHGAADERVAAAAAEAGFRLGFTTSRKAVTPATHPLLAGRITPAAQPPARCALQLLNVLVRAPTRAAPQGSANY